MLALLSWLPQPHQATAARGQRPRTSVKSYLTLPASSVAAQLDSRNTTRAVPSLPCVCCRPSTFLHWAARAFSFARSLFCPFSELALPLLLPSPLSALLQASRPPSPWSVPSLSVFLTADCTYNCMLIPLCTGEAIPHPYGLLTPPSSPGTSAWMAQGIILPLSLHPAACAPKHTVRPVRRLFIQGTR